MATRGPSRERTGSDGLPDDDRTAVGESERIIDARHRQLADMQRELDSRTRVLREQGWSIAQRMLVAVERARTLVTGRAGQLDRARPPEAGERRAGRETVGTAPGDARTRAKFGIRRARALREQTVTQASKLARVEGAIADLYDDLARLHPDNSQHFLEIADAAREGARRARETADRFRAEAPSQHREPDGQDGPEPAR